MSHNTVALQGERGAYSHLSAQKLYPDMEPMFCTSFEDVFQAVESGKAQYGVIPVENSTAGRVSDVHPLMDKTNLKIIKEFFLPINHCLLGLKGAKIDEIADAYSHIQALMQCEHNLKKLNIKRHAFHDTAGAAAWLSKHGQSHQAAIASSLAGEVYGLDVLEENLQDTKHNTTRFIVLSREEIIPDFDIENQYLTTLIFKVRNIPAALYKALGGFALNGVNITKLESYIDEDGGMHSAKFYVDIEAHLQDPRMKYAMHELEFYSEYIKVLGVYPSAKRG